MAELRFPDGFQWGVATASYQIEGAFDKDNRGLSIWDTYAHQPGRVFNGDTGDVACDHYHRYEEDFDLMAKLGIKHYRFSIAWPRIYPFGAGAVNEAGLQFYDRIINALLARGIEPMATLYHWDLPQALQDQGGWANREIIHAYRDYAKTCFDRFGDRVTKWITHNEPFVFVMFGHRQGIMAPGIRSLEITARATHHQFLAHGLAVRAFREGGYPGEIGLTNANTSYEPADDTPETVSAVEFARDFDSRLFHGPLFGQGYPASVLKYYAERGAGFPIIAGDMALIAEPIDFLGLNIYSRQLVEAGDGTGVGFREAAPRLPLLPMGYEAAPHVLGDHVRWISAEYGNPKIYITENGVCDNTEPGPDGQVNDTIRIELLGGFLAGLHSAITDGADVRAYYQWSFMDNFEWSFGNSKRFGIVHTNFDTLTRTPKKSAAWYADVIRRNAVTVID